MPAQVEGDLPVLVLIPECQKALLIKEGVWTEERRGGVLVVMIKDPTVLIKSLEVQKICHQVLNTDSTALTIARRAREEIEEAPDLIVQEGEDTQVLAEEEDHVHLHTALAEELDHQNPGDLVLIGRGEPTVLTEGTTALTEDLGALAGEG